LTENRKVELSIVIVSYKVRERLRLCLDSLRAVVGDSPRHEVIVVDNDSGDGTVETLSGVYPEVRFLAMDRNLGFSIGCNRGAALASGEWILFLNPDTVVYPGTLKEILEFAQSKPDAGIVGCRILDGDGQLQLACRRSIPTPAVAFWRLTGLSFLFPKNKVLGKYNLAYLEPNESYPVEAVSGSFLLIRSQVYRQVEGFDEIFFLYGEDLDLCLRVAKAGWKVWYCGTSSIVHHKGQSAAARPWGARMDFYRAMVTFARKNFGVGAFMGGLLSILAGMLATGGHLGTLFHRWRRMAVDLASINLALFAISFVWLYLTSATIYLTPGRPDWIWHVVLSASMMGMLMVAGEYSQAGAGRLRFPSALLAGAAGFLTTGFIWKSAVFSRGSFILGAAAAVGLVALRHRWSMKLRPDPRRAVVAGTGPGALELARKLAHSSQVRVLGLLAVEESDSWGHEDILTVARMPHATPALHAMEISAIVVPGDSAEIAGLLRQLSQMKGIRILLALPASQAGVPVLVDITLDNTFPPERSK
jgi:GT2 family glycosyltransferase